MLRNIGFNNDREKGFSIYYQGANRDSNINTKTSTDVNHKKRTKRWGSPFSLILGHKPQVDKGYNESQNVNTQEIIPNSG
jgi:hypothetical protein